MRIFTVSVIFVLVVSALGQGQDPSGVSVDLSGNVGSVPDLSTVLDSMGVPSGSSVGGGMPPESSLLPSFDSSLSPSSAVGGQGDPFGSGFVRDPNGFGPGPTDLRLESRTATGSGAIDAATGAPLGSSSPRDPRLTGGARLPSDPRSADFRDPRFMSDPRDPRFGTDLRDPRLALDPRDPRASLPARSRMPVEPRMSLDPRFVDPRDPRYDPRGDMFTGGLDRRPLMGFDALGRPIFMDGSFPMSPMAPRFPAPASSDPRFGGSVADPRFAGSAVDPRFASRAGAAGFPSGDLSPLPPGTSGFAGNETLPPVDPRATGFDSRRLPPTVDPRFGPTGPMMDPRFGGFPPYSGFPVSPYPPFFGSRFGPSMGPGPAYLPPPTFVPSGTSRFLTSGFPPGFATSVGPTFGGPVDFPTGSSFSSAGFSPSAAGMSGVPGRFSPFSPTAAGAASFGVRGSPAAALGSLPAAGSSVPFTGGAALTDSVGGASSGVGL